MQLLQLGQQGRAGLRVDLGEDHLRMSGEHALDLAAVRTLVQREGLVVDDRPAEPGEGADQRRHVGLRAGVVAEHGGRPRVARLVRPERERVALDVVGGSDPPEVGIGGVVKGGLAGVDEHRHLALVQQRDGGQRLIGTRPEHPDQ